MKLDLTIVNPRFHSSTTKNSSRNDYSSICKWYSSSTTSTITAITTSCEDDSNGSVVSCSIPSSFCHPCHPSDFINATHSNNTAMKSPTSILLLTTSPASDNGTATTPATTSTANSTNIDSSSSIASITSSSQHSYMIPYHPDPHPRPPPPRLVLPELFDENEGRNDKYFKEPRGGGGGRMPSTRKLELCQSTLKGITCPIGKMCNFAHDTSELELTTLRQRAKAGIIDIHTYRTRPCLDYVMTGSW
jgi:hypothetical protein